MIYIIFGTAANTPSPRISTRTSAKQSIEKGKVEEKEKLSVKGKEEVKVKAELPDEAQAEQKQSAEKSEDKKEEKTGTVNKRHAPETKDRSNTPHAGTNILKLTLFYHVCSPQAQNFLVHIYNFVYYFYLA